MEDSADVVIIGGGVIGLAVARALALRGIRDVLLLERNSLGGESSSAAAGMLAPQAEANRAHEFFYLTCQSRDMYPAFARRVGVARSVAWRSAARIRWVRRSAFGEWADAARDRGDRRGADLDRSGEVHIPHDPAVDDVDPDVDHDRAGLEHSPR